MNNVTNPEQVDSPTSPSPASTDPTTQAQHTKPPTSTRRWGTWFVLCILFIAIGAGGASYVLWRQFHQTGDALAERLAQTESRVDLLQAQGQKLNDKISIDLSEKLGKIEDKQLGFDHSLQALHGEVRDKIGVPQTLIEVENLVRLADHSLLIELDIAKALKALTAALELLAETDDPQIVNIQSLLAKDINALSEIEQPDIIGMALNLNGLANNVDNLPLTSRTPDAAGPHDEPKAKDWRSLLHIIWSELKSLVVIRYENKTARPFIPPSQDYFLYQNLRLELESARLSLLRRDVENFHASLNTASAWLTRYFDVSAPLTVGMLETLSHLKQTDINPPLPEISSTLTILRDLVKQKSSNARATSPDTTAAGITQDHSAQTLSTPEDEAIIPSIDSGMAAP